MSDRHGSATGGRRGQSTAEYAILFAVVLGAIVAMQVYVKRGSQGRIKMVTDTAVGHVLGRFGNATPAAKDLQYEPYYASSDFKTERDESHRMKMETGGVAKRIIVRDETNRTGSQDTAGAQ